MRVTSEGWSGKQVTFEDPPGTPVGSLTFTRRREPDVADLHGHRYSITPDHRARRTWDVTGTGGEPPVTIRQPSSWRSAYELVAADGSVLQVTSSGFLRRVLTLVDPVRGERMGILTAQSTWGRTRWDLEVGRLGPTAVVACVWVAMVVTRNDAAAAAGAGVAGAAVAAGG